MEQAVDHERCALSAQGKAAAKGRQGLVYRRGLHPLRGRVAAERQIRQDKNARGVSMMALAQRQSAKASTLYDNASWDLVDAEKKGQVELESLAAKDLPEDMREMSVEERKAHVEAKAKERAAIQAKIKTLTTERREFVAEALKKRGKSGDNTLDAAIIATVREQAARKRFTFDK